jgi:hypothetical protein
VGLDIILQQIVVACLVRQHQVDLDIILQQIVVACLVRLDMMVDPMDLRSTQGAASLLLQLMRLSTKFTLMSAKLVVVRSALHLWQF